MPPRYFILLAYVRHVRFPPFFFRPRPFRRADHPFVPGENISRLSSLYIPRRLYSNLNIPRPLCRVFIFIGERAPPTRVIRSPALAGLFTFFRKPMVSFASRAWRRRLGAADKRETETEKAKLSRRAGKLAVKCSARERGFAAPLQLKFLTF